jgi:hypothetical protein
MHPAWLISEKLNCCKKAERLSRPQRGCHLPNSPRPRIIKLFLRESLTSDIPAGVGKTTNRFLQCSVGGSCYDLPYNMTDKEMGIANK